MLKFVYNKVTGHYKKSNSALKKLLAFKCDLEKLFFKGIKAK